MTAYLAWRERPELRKVVIFWRPAALVGLMSVVGSAAWFTAMTLQNVAYVRALGQVELALTILVSRFGFGERPTRRELAGIALIAAGVVVLLPGGGGPVRGPGPARRPPPAAGPEGFGRANF